MNGLMMQESLLISSLLAHAERHLADQHVVSRRVEGDIHLVVDAAGHELPWDGKTSRGLLVRGAWVAAQYLGDEGGDPLLQSGGEWIGSIDLENNAMAHPAVAMAASTRARRAKWDQRPLMVVEWKPGASLRRDGPLAYFAGKVVKWWPTDDVVFVEAIPLRATGKMLKNRLREQFGNHLLEMA